MINQTVLVDVTPTITAGAYSAADVIGGVMTIPTQSAGGSGIIRRIIIADDDNEKAAMTLYFYSGSPTSIADNAAFAPLHADNKMLLATVTVAGGDYVTVNSNAYAVKDGLSIEYTSTAGAIYCYAVVTATPTYTATTDLTFRFLLWKD